MNQAKNINRELQWTSKGNAIVSMANYNVVRNKFWWEHVLGADLPVIDLNDNYHSLDLAFIRPSPFDKELVQFWSAAETLGRLYSASKYFKCKLDLDSPQGLSFDSYYFNCRRKPLLPLTMPLPMTGACIDGEDKNRPKSEKSELNFRCKNDELFPWLFQLGLFEPICHSHYDANGSCKVFVLRSKYTGRLIKVNMNWTVSETAATLLELKANYGVLDVSDLYMHEPLTYAFICL